MYKHMSVKQDDKKTSPRNEAPQWFIGYAWVGHRHRPMVRDGHKVQGVAGKDRGGL